MVQKKEIWNADARPMKTSAPTMALTDFAVAPMILPMRAMKDPVMKNLLGKKARDVSNSISHSCSAVEGGLHSPSSSKDIRQATNKEEEDGFQQQIHQKTPQHVWRWAQLVVDIV